MSGLIGPAGGDPVPGAVVAGIDRVGAARLRGAKRLLGIFMSAGLAQQITQVDLRGSHAWLEADGCAVVGNCLVDPIESCPGQAPVVVGFGSDIGRCCEEPIKAGCGKRCVASGPGSDAAIVKGGRIVRGEGYGLRIVVERGRDIAGAMKLQGELEFGRHRGAAFKGMRILSGPGWVGTCCPAGGNAQQAGQQRQR